MGYDRGGSFHLNFEPNGVPFGSENRKENCHHGHIPFNAKGNGNIVFSMHCQPSIHNWLALKSHMKSVLSVYKQIDGKQTNKVHIKLIQERLTPSQYTEHIYTQFILSEKKL